MDNNNNNNSNNNFFSGFLLGLLIGAAVVFLLGTKKGKRIWKAISEGGVDNISNLLDEANQSTPALRPASKTFTADAKVSNFAEASRDKSEGRREFAFKERAIEEKPKVRRFFRGISRRLN